MKSDVRWVSNNAIETFTKREIEEIHNPRTFWCNSSIEFYTNAITILLSQLSKKSTVTYRWLKDAATIGADVEHKVDDLRRGEDLPEVYYVSSVHCLQI